MSRLLWAAQGVTGAEGERTAPSAGAMYPIDVHLVAGPLDGLGAGVYRYEPASHRLRPVAGEDRRRRLAEAALGQTWIGAAPAAIVVAAVFERTARRYGPRAERYVWVEAGCVAQNVALQAEALGLGITVVGAFHDDEVARVVGLAPEERPLLVLPIGRK